MHKWQATDVSGISGGKLMCETRLETRASRSETTITDPTTHYTKKHSVHHIGFALMVLAPAKVMNGCLFVAALLRQWTNRTCFRTFSVHLLAL